MKLESKIRVLASTKTRVRVSGKKRGRFIVLGPDGVKVVASSRREALQNLLARLRCWEPMPWLVIDEARAKKLLEGQ